MTIIERILETAEQKGIKQVDIAKLINKGTAQITSWKKRECNPPAEFIPPIAELLNVSIQWLMTGEEETERGLTTEEQKMLTLYRRLDQKDRREIVGIIDLKLQQDERERKILESKIG